MFGIFDTVTYVLSGKLIISMDALDYNKKLDKFSNPLFHHSAVGFIEELTENERKILEALRDPECWKHCLGRIKEKTGIPGNETVLRVLRNLKWKGRVEMKRCDEVDGKPGAVMILFPNR